MTKDQLAKWANQAGAFLELSTTPEKDMAFLQRFASLVAAQAAAEEREACAKVCDEVEEPAWYGYECPHTFQDGRLACVAAIRARQKETS